MKVLIFSVAYLPFIGGAELAVKEITDRIDDIDFELITVNLDGKQKSEEKIGNIKVYRLGIGKLAKYFFPWASFRKAKQLHQEKKFDAIWAIMANQAGLGALKFKKYFPDVKYLLTLQEGDSLKDIWLRTWFIRPLYKRIYQKADRIQSISQYLKTRAVKYGYLGQVEIVPNGVDIKNFSQDFSAEELFQLKVSLGIKKDEKVVVSASRLVEKNGLDILIKAMKDIPARLLLLGVGPLESKLRALSQELGQNGKVIFAGHVDHKDLPKYLKLADVFVRPSRSEGLGSAFLEAMAVGLPVVATPVGGIVDFLKDGQTGLFCQVNNPKSLAEKINLILSDQLLKQQLINNGLTTVKQKYDWLQISQQMNKLFHNL